MIKIENVDVVGLDPAIRGMRNPMNSWDKSDSGYCQGRSKHCDTCYLKPEDDYAPCYYATEKKGKEYVVGSNDLTLMYNLATGGSDHAKYRRMIVVYLDITAPLYWWKEFDTYKVGTVSNSCSTMHKIHAKEFTLDDFSHEHLEFEMSKEALRSTIDVLNAYREYYIHENGELKKTCWWQMIQLLPSSYNQRRTIMLNYEVLTNIYHARKNHKLDEWREFCNWIETLPYAEGVIFKENDV